MDRPCVGLPDTALNQKSLLQREKVQTEREDCVLGHAGHTCEDRSWSQAPTPQLGAFGEGDRSAVTLTSSFRGGGASSLRGLDERG